MEQSAMMKQFPRFTEYLDTQPTYDQIKNMLNQNSIVSENLAKFTLNLPVVEINEITDLPYPPGWEQYFLECKAEIDQALVYVNSQIRLGKNVFPRRENIFRAFTFHPINLIRVIVIGQDPYHSRDYDTGECVANGLSFSCNGSKIQPSLINIMKELENSFGMRPPHGNLDHWAQQGVLMLNKCLTVNEGEAKSHGDAWKFFVHKILNIVLANVPFCFLCLWGNEAQKLVEGSNKLTFSSQKILVMKAGHPSGLNTKNPFVGCGHFLTINQLLIQNGQAPINWIGV
jgi:uracil-DNA glycosylase